MIKQKKPRGFTLIELVMSIVLLSIMVAPSLNIMANLLRISVDPEIYSVSVALAEQELERVSGLPFAQIVNAGPITYPGNFLKYNYQIIVSPVPVALADDAAMTNYKQVQILIGHIPTGRNVTLTTVAVNNV